MLNVQEGTAVNTSNDTSRASRSKDGSLDLEGLEENDSPVAEFNVNYLTAFSVVVREPDESSLPNLTQVGGEVVSVDSQEVMRRGFIKDFIKENPMKLSERQADILMMIAEDDTLTSQKIAQKTGVSQRTILKDLTELQSVGILVREGGRKDGRWVIVTDNKKKWFMATFAIFNYQFDKIIGHARQGEFESMESEVS